MHYGKLHSHPIGLIRASKTHTSHSDYELPSKRQWEFRIHGYPKTCFSLWYFTLTYFKFAGFAVILCNASAERDPTGGLDSRWVSASVILYILFICLLCYLCYLSFYQLPKWWLWKINKGELFVLCVSILRDIACTTLLKCCVICFHLVVFVVYVDGTFLSVLFGCSWGRWALPWILLSTSPDWSNSKSAALMPSTHSHEHLWQFLLDFYSFDWSEVISITMSADKVRFMKGAIEVFRYCGGVYTVAEASKALMSTFCCFRTWSNK